MTDYVLFLYHENLIESRNSICAYSVCHIDNIGRKPREAFSIETQGYSGNPSLSSVINGTDTVISLLL